MKKMKVCAVCKQYTLEREHCQRMALPAHPAPFNPRDPWGAYRRRAAGIGTGI